MQEILDPIIPDEKFFTRPLAIVFCTIIIDLIGFGIAIPVLPQFARDHFGASPFQIGWIIASYSIMQFIFAPFIGRLSDIYGRRPVLLISILGTSVAAFITGMATTITMVVVGRILDGITAGNITTAQAYIADVTSKKNRARGMGMMGAAFGVGFILGPAIGGLTSRFGANVPFFVVSGLALINATLLYFVLPESLKPENRVTTGMRGIADAYASLKDRSLAIISLNYFLLVLSFSIMTTAFVLFTTHRFGYNAENNGYVFSFIGILAVLMQAILFVRLQKSFGEMKLSVIGSLLLVGSLAAMPFIRPESGGLIALLLGSAFITFGNSLASPSLTSLASKCAHEGEQGRVLGVLQSGASLARAAGPALCGILLNNQFNELDDSTIQRTFLTAAAIMFCAFLVAVYFAVSQARRAVPA